MTVPLKIADRWFERRKVDDDITLLWEPHVIPLMRCNIWHVRGRDRDLLVDTGLGVASLRDAVVDLIDNPVIACATHAHGDHVGGHHEFAECLVHHLEANDLRSTSASNTLYLDDPAFVAYLNSVGYPGHLDQCMITALPHADYDPGAYVLKGASVTRIVEEGDIVDLGNRRFEILHLPGHSPGSIGLWESASGTLFSGDCVYDGPLLDGLGSSNIEDYINSMTRLRGMPIDTIHAGHDPSFGRLRLHELIDHYLAGKGDRPS
jgi:glyoxylase-like metal-dependent hydrolase (beta-lactamase superfamily II)